MGEMKNGFQADRLSACGFGANSFRLLVHTLAYAMVVLFREALATVPEVATATVNTLRQRLWKAGAVVVTSPRRIGLHFAASWPYQGLWRRVASAVQNGVQQWPGGAARALPAAGGLPR
jgi:hypothetical protein